MDVQDFKNLLMNEDISSQTIVRRHLLYGNPFFYNNPDIYVSLKEDIANQFNTHPHNVIMVGSGKLGFSIAPYKKWKLFDEESDIDIVIVSEQAYIKFWKELFLFNSNISRDEREEKNFQDFKDYFFRGWIRPDLFNFAYEGKNEWFDFFRDMTIQYGNGHKIAGALYFNFEFFEKYHINNIDNLRRWEMQND